MHNVVAPVVEKLLSQSVAEAYVKWRESTPGGNFGKWIGTVVENEAIAMRTGVELPRLNAALPVNPAP